MKQIQKILLFIALCLIQQKAIAQCLNPDGTVRQSYYNIMIAIDHSYIDDFFGGDVILARMKAEEQVNTAIGAQGLNTPTRPFANFYKLTFRNIFFPTY